MVWFFRDFLDGPIYIIYALILVILIMAIIGFIMERKKFEEEEKNRIAVLNSEEYNPLTQTPETQNDVTNNETVAPTIEVTPSINVEPSSMVEVGEEPTIIVDDTPAPSITVEETVAPSIIVEESVANETVSEPINEPQEIIKEENAATNTAIPGVLDLNVIEEKLNDENKA